MFGFRLNVEDVALIIVLISIKFIAKKNFVPKLVVYFEDFTLIVETKVTFYELNHNFLINTV